MMYMQFVLNLKFNLCLGRVVWYWSVSCAFSDITLLITLLMLLLYTNDNVVAILMIIFLSPEHPMCIRQILYNHVQAVCYKTRMY